MQANFGEFLPDEMAFFFGDNMPQTMATKSRLELAGNDRLNRVTVAAGFVGHQFWNVDPAQFGNQLNNFLKNLAIASGLLYMTDREAEVRSTRSPTVT